MNDIKELITFIFAILCTQEIDMEKTKKIMYALSKETCIDIKKIDKMIKNFNELKNTFTEI